jgi:hypothetical protein
MNWIPVSERKPYCSRDPDALGTPILVWPRLLPDADSVACMDGFAYYGRRASGQPAFYLHGAVIHGVTHWMPLPAGPSDTTSEVQGEQELTGVT